MLKLTLLSYNPLAHLDDSKELVASTAPFQTAKTEAETCLLLNFLAFVYFWVCTRFETRGNLTLRATAK